MGNTIRERARNAPAAQPQAQRNVAKNQAARNTAKVEKTRADKAAAKPAVNPMDVLRNVKNGDVNIQVPIRDAEFAGGLLKIKKGTTMTLQSKAVNGKLDRSKTTITFNPPLDGPLWADVRGAKLDADGRLQIDIKGFPDPKLGPKLPADLDGVADALQGVMDSKKVGVNFLGFELGEFGPSDLPGSGGGGGGGKTDPNKFVNIDKIKIAVKGAELEEGKLSLGPAGAVKFGPGNKVDITGTPRDLNVRGRANIESLALDTNGVKLKGAGGSGDFNISYKRDAKGNARVDTRIDNLNLHTKYAVAKRANGDFIQLAKGQIKGGSVNLSTSFHQDGVLSKPENLKHQLGELDIKKFSGTIDKARLTIPDGKDTAQVLIGKSTVSGDVNVTPGRIQFNGKMDVKARVRDYQGGFGPAHVDIDQADLSGKGQVSFDSKKGFGVKDADIGVQARFNSAGVKAKLPIVGLPASASIGKGSQVGFKLDDVNFSSKNGFESVGRVRANVDVRDVKAAVGPIDVEKDRIKFEVDSGPLDGPSKPDPKPNKPDPKPDEPQKPDAPSKPNRPTRKELLKQVRARHWVQRGSRGPEVERLQKMLAKAGFDPGPVDGSYGPRTEAAVRAFQRKKKLIVDGLTGQQTWSALYGLDPTLKPGRDLLAG